MSSFELLSSSSLLIAKPSQERPLDFFVKIRRKIPLKNGGFQAEKLANTFFISNFAPSTRGIARPPAAQPDTRTGKPNTGAYKPNTGAYKPNTDAYKAINGESAESWYAASC